MQIFVHELEATLQKVMNKNKSIWPLSATFQVNIGKSCYKPNMVEVFWVFGLTSKGDSNMKNPWMLWAKPSLWLY